jgi:hypothetical protein
MGYERYKSCIDACIACATMCKYCGSECLKEDDVKMLGPCVQLDAECSLICMSTAELLMIGGENATLLCEACESIYNACAEECEKHDMEHCHRCAEACRHCAQECHQMVEHV